MNLLTWDGHNINDGTNYVAVLNADFYGLPGIQAVGGARTGAWPLLGSVNRPGREVHLEIFIRSGTSLQLMQWFDPEDEDPKALVAEDNGGGNNRYVNAICTELREIPFSAGLHYGLTLFIVGDVRWRKVTADTDTWNISSDSDTNVLANGGEDDAYPILTITPTSGKTGGYSYRRFIAIRWNSDLPAANYPIDVNDDNLDLGALYTAGHIEDINYDDVRLFVNGKDFRRSIISSTLDYIWTQLSFAPRFEWELKTAVNASATTLELQEDATGRFQPLPDRLPSRGILMIGNEIITYEAKQTALGRVTGCTRGAKDTTAASHSAGDTVIWIQHDIEILYGNTDPPDPLTLSEDSPFGRPQFTLLQTSDNGEWEFIDFYNTQPGKTYVFGWLFSGNATPYGGQHFAYGNTYDYAGIACSPSDENPIKKFVGYWTFYHPLGISGVNFASLEIYAELLAAGFGKTTFIASVESSEDGITWIEEYAWSEPSSADTWESGAHDVSSITAGSKFVRLKLSKPVGDFTTGIEANEVHITITSANVPTITMGSEEGNYHLDALITNNATGEAIRVTMNMEPNEDLEINTDEKTVIYLFNNLNSRNALEVVGEARKKWLRLVPGNNTIQFDDVGTNGVTIESEWEERHYQ